MNQALENLMQKDVGLKSESKIDPSSKSTSNMEDFFTSEHKSYIFKRQQEQNSEQFIGYILSHSNTPDLKHPKANIFRKELLDIFKKLSHNGVLTFDYNTELIIGRLKK